MKSNKKEFDKPDFIEVYPKAFSKGYCEELIRIIDDLDELGMLKERHGRDNVTISDSSLVFPRCEDTYKEQQYDIKFANRAFLDNFMDIFWNVCYPKYMKKYGVLTSLGKHKVSCVKAQKTKPGEGYHVWHCEVMTLLIGLWLGQCI